MHAASAGANAPFDGCFECKPGQKYIGGFAGRIRQRTGRSDLLLITITRESLPRGQESPTLIALGEMKSPTWSGLGLHVRAWLHHW